MKKWFLVRHVRWLWYNYQVNKHYDMWKSLGYFPVNAKSDVEVLDAIWRGEQ